MSAENLSAGGRPVDTVTDDLVERVVERVAERMADRFGAIVAVPLERIATHLAGFGAGGGEPAGSTAPSRGRSAGNDRASWTPDEALRARLTFHGADMWKDLNQKEKSKGRLKIWDNVNARS